MILKSNTRFSWTGKFQLFTESSPKFIYFCSKVPVGQVYLPWHWKVMLFMLQLTPIGKKMAAFPLDPRLSKTILVSKDFHCRYVLSFKGILYLNYTPLPLFMAT